MRIYTDILVKEYKQDYYWREAFQFADGFSIDDIETVFVDDEGHNDGEPWLSYGRLKDGRCYFLSAWCDYTGWDCQSGGDCALHTDRAFMERYQMSDRDRARLGIVLEEVDGVKPIPDIED